MQRERLRKRSTFNFNLLFTELTKPPQNFRAVLYYIVAGPAGLEPVTSRVTGGCSNQLSYDPSSQLTTGAPENPEGVFGERHANTEVVAAWQSQNAETGVLIGPWCRREELHL